MGRHAHKVRPHLIQNICNPLRLLHQLVDLPRGMHWQSIPSSPRKLLDPPDPLLAPQLPLGTHALVIQIGPVDRPKPQVEHLGPPPLRRYGAVVDRVCQVRATAAAKPASPLGAGLVKSEMDASPI